MRGEADIDINTFVNVCRHEVCHRVPVANDADIVDKYREWDIGGYIKDSFVEGGVAGVIECYGLALSVEDEGADLDLVGGFELAFDGGELGWVAAMEDDIEAGGREFMRPCNAETVGCTSYQSPGFGGRLVEAVFLAISREGRRSEVEIQKLCDLD
jgi:hypothetical protein